ncbi:hypothetical protein [Halomonas salipaludis]|nr:hypothetical protein [Halomonas salipaludis]
MWHSSIVVDTALGAVPLMTHQVRRLLMGCQRSGLFRRQACEEAL